MTPITRNDITTDRADHVRELQQYLRIIRREKDGATDVPIDGFFGPLTAAAVRQSQQEGGLPESGAVDRATWEWIFANAQQIICLRALPTPVQAFGMGQPPLRVGDSSDSVHVLQVMLATLAARFTNLPANDTPNGVYTAATADAVRLLQRQAGLAATGVVDKPTWDAITILYNQGI
ncbi:MAG: peptidoglycan-binding protein [Clostridia bacterium]|nr:peptidoglycan-binding protein [Clostridia bacterium]